MGDTRCHPGPAAIELSATPDRHYLLPLPVRHERGEGWGEGFSSWANNLLSARARKKGCSAKCEAGLKRASSPRPSPPFRMEERESPCFVSVKKLKAPRRRP